MQRRAQQAGVVGGAVAQLHAGGSQCGQVGVVAVEVVPGAQLKPALHPPGNLLRQTDGIASGQQHDLAPQATGLLQRQQSAAQVLRHQHGRNFVGMKARLNQRPARPAGQFGAEVVPRDGARSARRAARQRVNVCLHGVQRGAGAATRAVWVVEDAGAALCSAGSYKGERNRTGKTSSSMRWTL